MTSGVKIAVAGLGLVSAGIGLTAYWNRRAWTLRTRQLVDEMAAADQIAKTISFENFDLLPEPVSKYLRLTLTEGRPYINSALIEHSGELNVTEKSQDRWMPFTSTQFVSARRPGFVWDARIRAGRWIPMRVRDAYVAGHGSSQVTALSLITLADDHGQFELAQGALIRYLAESVWLPTSLLPSANLVWSPIGGNRALATLTDSGVSVSLEFTFNDAGEVSSVYTPGRYRAVGAAYELTPWTGRHWRYEERNGMRIPSEAEVEWRLPQGARSVWKGKMMKIEYAFANDINPKNSVTKALL